MSGKHSLEIIAVGLLKDISSPFSSLSLRQLLLLKYNPEFFIFKNLVIEMSISDLEAHDRSCSPVSFFHQCHSYRIRLALLVFYQSQPLSSYTCIFYWSSICSKPFQLWAPFSTQQFTPRRPGTKSWLGNLIFVEINKVFPNERSKVIQSLPEQGCQPPLHAFWQRIKHRQEEVGKL